MNSKLLIPIGLVVLALVAALVILSLLDTNVEKASSSSRPTPVPTAPATTPAPAELPDRAAISITPQAAPDVSTGPITTMDQALAADTANNESARNAVLDMIDEATVTYDVQGLVVLGPLLRHPDHEMREAAIEGIVQLGETAGAKTLREAARRTGDSRDAKRMIEAAEFLELPVYGSIPAGPR